MLEVRNVSKAFFPHTINEKVALRDISLKLASGDFVTVIGSNGAGKSTLVRAIAGILPPTEGRIEVRGKVSTLLALGVGFNGAMSGQENVMLGGLAAGYTRDEIAEKYAEIADFAELGDFMEMPMKTYSSGMFSRLAFAVAVHMEPDILLVDEALSAGDAKFKEKAAAKMKSLVAEARTMFLVSHALASITDLCNDAIWLNKGTLMMRGEPSDVVKEYTRFVKVGESAYTLEDM